jgi:hypothetical protein
MKVVRSRLTGEAGEAGEAGSESPGWEQPIAAPQQRTLAPQRESNPGAYKHADYPRSGMGALD